MTEHVVADVFSGVIVLLQICMTSKTLNATFLLMAYVLLFCIEYHKQNDTL